MKLRQEIGYGAAAALLALAAGGAAGCGGGDEPAPPDGGTEQAIGIHGPGGWLQGTVQSADYPGVVLPLADAAVYARNVFTNVDTPAVSSNFHGGFAVPVGNGSYKVCWSKPGFTSGCTATIYSINNKGRTLPPLALTTALTRRVRGTALLADGTPCLTDDRFMSASIAARADLLSSSNAVLYTTRLNFRGEWVLPNPGSGAKVRITCGALTAEAPTSGMSTTAPYKFTLANRRPFITPVSATAGGQDATRGVLPGTVVQLATTATDPEGHALTYRWRAAAGTLPNTGTTSAQWTAPATPGTFSAYLSANDGRGGYSTRVVSIRVRTDPKVVVSGNVRDDSGAVIAGAAVTIGGASATTDGAGHFSLTIPEADSYLLNIRKVGYAELSRALDAPPRGQKLTLVKATAVPFDPTVVNVIVDDGRPKWLNPCLPRASCPRRPGRVTVPANALDLGTPPVGPLTAYIATYDVTAEAIPGDQTAINSAGERTALVSYGALFIEIRDAAGTKFNLAPGRTAKLEIPIQPAIAAEGPPGAMDMWKYDPAAGVWRERAASGVRIGDYYTIDVPSFSTQNADIEKQNPSCLYVDIDDAVIAQRQVRMRLQVPVSIGGAVRTYEKELDEPRNTVYNLPTAVPYTLEIFEVANGVTVLKQPLTGLTGGAWGGVGNPGLAEPDCAVQKVLVADLDDNAASRFLSYPGVGDLPTAERYYLEIDPQGTRATLGGFWLANGFDQSTGEAPDGYRTYFINNNDLGFGRDMHCRKDPVTSDVACYVSNYGAGDQAPGNFDLAKAANEADSNATVAMEYSPGPTGTKIVKFYVYAGAAAASERVEFADLDGAGQKFVPHLCLNCHGGRYQPANPNDPTPAELDMGSSFREFDIYSFRDGTLGDKPNELASGLHEIVNLDPASPPLGQQASFLAQNLIVRDTVPQAAITELINKWYNNNDTLPFDKDAVPLGWVVPGPDEASIKDLYLKVVATGCRTCHVAQESTDSYSKAWSTYDQFKTHLGLSIPYAVCFGDPAQPPADYEQYKRTRYMPHSNVTFKNFWRDPSAYNTLGNFTGPGWATSINADPQMQCAP